MIFTAMRCMWRWSIKLKIGQCAITFDHLRETHGQSTDGSHPLATRPGTHLAEPAFVQQPQQRQTTNNQQHCTLYRRANCTLGTRTIVSKETKSTTIWIYYCTVDSPNKREATTESLSRNNRHSIDNKQKQHPRHTTHTSSSWRQAQVSPIALATAT